MPLCICDVHGEQSNPYTTTSNLAMNPSGFYLPCADWTAGKSDCTSSKRDLLHQDTSEGPSWVFPLKAQPLFPRASFHPMPWPWRNEWMNKWMNDEWNARKNLLAQGVMWHLENSEVKLSPQSEQLRVSQLLRQRLAGATFVFIE